MRHIAPRLVVALAALGLLAPPAGARPVPRRVARPLLRLDAGPKAAPALDLAKLPVEPGAAALCRAELDAMGCDPAAAAPGDPPACSCEVRVFYAAPPTAPIGPTEIHRAAFVDARGTVMPGRTQALALAVETTGGGWQKLAALGTGDVGGMGTHLVSSTDVITAGGSGVADLGQWVWADVMQNSAAPDDGTEWTRTLWLCGGDKGVACHPIPLKYWFTAKVDGYAVDKSNLPKAKGPLYALAATLAAAGTLTVTAKTRTPKRLAKLIGKHRLDALDGLITGPE